MGMEAADLVVTTLGAQTLVLVGVGLAGLLLFTINYFSLLSTFLEGRIKIINFNNYICYTLLYRN